MRLEYGNILEMEADVICITTNGFVKSNGEAVMGRGIAKQIADLFTDIPAILGMEIQINGNRVNELGVVNDIELWSFPVKPKSVYNNGSNVVNHAAGRYTAGQQVPGFHAKADLKIIEQSCKELVEMASAADYKRIILPYPGCGAGELDWADVKPILDKYLDDRFIAVTYNP